VHQAEDEIAAAAFAVGSSYAGKCAVTDDIGKKIKYRRPSRLPPLTEDMPLAKKLSLVRQRVHAKTYTPFRHPAAPRERSKAYLNANTRSAHIRKYIKKDSPNKQTFTFQELEANWLSLCLVMDFVGGNKKLLAETIGVSHGAVHQWIKTGRVSPFGAYLIDRCPEIPLNKVQVRPDISAKAWQAFDRELPSLYARKDRQMYSYATRLGDEEDQL
jgi:DNA-binding transcriptional regulator YdaS (Cro superfamily)